MVDELDCPLIFEDESWFCPFDRCQVYLCRLNRNRNHYQSRYLAVRCYPSVTGLILIVVICLILIGLILIFI